MIAALRPLRLGSATLCGSTALRFICVDPSPSVAKENMSCFSWCSFVPRACGPFVDRIFYGFCFSSVCSLRTLRSLWQKQSFGLWSFPLCAFVFKIFLCTLSVVLRVSGRRPSVVKIICVHPCASVAEDVFWFLVSYFGRTAVRPYIHTSVISAFSVAE